MDASVGLLADLAEIGDLTAADLMLPRTELPTIAIDASLDDLRTALGSKPPAWIAVYRRRPDDVEGLFWCAK